MKPRELLSVESIEKMKWTNKISNEIILRRVDEVDEVSSTLTVIRLTALDISLEDTAYYAKLSRENCRKLQVSEEESS